jgi:hypothetical protein
MARTGSTSTKVSLKALATALVGLAELPGLAGCGGDNGSAAPSGPTRIRKTLGAPGARVRFVTPKEASTLGATVAVRVKLTHFQLAPNKVGKAARQGEGHLHFSLEQGTSTSANGGRSRTRRPTTGGPVCRSSST